MGYVVWLYVGVYAGAGNAGVETLDTLYKL